VNLARTMGVSRLVLTADPNAEPFYAAKAQSHRRENLTRCF